MKIQNLPEVTSNPAKTARTGIQRGLQYRTGDKSRIDSQSVKHFKVSGRVQVIGAGETSIDITFPVTFAERPAFSSGYELAANQTPEATNFPIVSVGVHHFVTVEMITGVFNYTGAVLMIVANGNPNYCWVHWHMEGRAFQNPLV